MTPPRKLRRSFRPLALAAAVMAASLGACGFHPLYGDRSIGAVSTVDLAAVQIDLIRDREGQMLRNELLDRFQPRGGTVEFFSSDPAARMSGKAALTTGSDDTGRIYGRFDSGLLGEGTVAV